MSFNDWNKLLLNLSHFEEITFGEEFDNEFKQEFFRQCSETGDNLNCIENIEYCETQKEIDYFNTGKDILVEKTRGIKLHGSQVYLSDICWFLENDHCVDSIVNEFNDVDENKARAALRAITILIHGFEKSEQFAK